jgi:hypothetical protein
MRQVREYPTFGKSLYDLLEADIALLLQLLVFIVAPAEAGWFGWLISRWIVFWRFCQHIAFPDSG